MGNTPPKFKVQGDDSGAFWLVHHTFFGFVGLVVILPDCCHFGSRFARRCCFEIFFCSFGSAISH